MFSALDVSSSALTAQRTRLNAIAGNIANMSTTHNESGQAVPYQPRFVVFQTDESIPGALGAAGVKVSSVETAQVEPRYKFQPGNPDAIKEGEHKGYVAYPNIDMTTEMVDAMEATRAYEANLGVIEITKNMAQQALRILA
ncbi:MAG TPA: flagellar basal body rod protein FlgC [Pirellulales bacterium]|jgi:flagellar basal-body rod protein FlgC|nr:flagellar basal body rod protein FlgC [Pirellulales bacterium]